MDVKTPTFVKWAGGKSKLLPQLKKFLPEKIERYFEPFLGGGAVFFYVKQVFKPREVLLSDINHILMEVFRNVRDNSDELKELLKEHKKNHNKDYYYDMRDKFNELDNTIEKSALFLYLNKTCFNGLYRVNSSGEFNVPIGSYKNPDIVNAANIQKASRLLQGVNLNEQDYKKVLDKVEEGDFIYLDPPYHPVSDTSSFTSYSKEDFTEKDQEELAEFCKKLDKKGAKFMLSNSDTDLINELYADFNIKKVEIRRMIGASAKSRKKVSEVVVTNY